MRNPRAFPGQFRGAGMVGVSVLFQWETSEMSGIPKGSTHYPPGMATQWMGTETKYPQMRWGHGGPGDGKNTTLNGKGLFWYLSCSLHFPWVCFGWHPYSSQDPLRHLRGFGIKHSGGYFAPATAASGSQNTSPWRVSEIEAWKSVQWD